MNCPRCRHGANPLRPGFYCSNCYACFLDEGASAVGIGLVSVEEEPQRFTIGRRTRIDTKSWVALAVCRGG
jgi:hypothetical protein